MYNFRSLVFAFKFILFFLTFLVCIFQYFPVDFCVCANKMKNFFVSLSLKWISNEKKKAKY